MNEIKIFNSEEFGDIRTVQLNNETCYLNLVRKRTYIPIRINSDGHCSQMPETEEYRYKKFSPTPDIRSRIRQ